MVVSRDKTPSGRSEAGPRSRTEVPTERRLLNRASTFINYLHSDGSSNLKPTKRRCTDVFCLLFFISYCAILSYSYKLSLKEGHLERITHGFDYRGRICGMGDQKNTTYLLWCSPKGESISWVDPVCVEQCPTKDHLPTVMCPLPKVKREQEIPEENGTIRIVQTVEQSLIPSATFPTKNYLSYCLPEAESDVITNMLLNTVESGIGAGKHLTQAQFVYSRAKELWDRWTLIFLAAFFAVCFAYVYLLLLRYCARPFIYATFTAILVFSMVFSYLCFCKSYAVVQAAISYTRSFTVVEWIEGNILMPLIYFTFQWTHYITDYAEGYIPDLKIMSDKIDEAYIQYGMKNATQPYMESIQQEIAGANARFVEAASPFLLKVDNFRAFSIEGMFRPMFGGYTDYALFGIGLGCLLLAFCIGSILLYSRKSLRTAISCVETACEVLFDVKMLLVLPFFQFLAWFAVIVAFAFPVMQIISTVPVEPTMLTVSGTDIFGLGRALSPGLEHFFHVCLWSFGLLWIQELISTLCHFVASYTAVEWFAAPWDGERKKARSLLIFRGVVIGFVYHLGSLALIAFSSAIVRFTRWVYYFVAKGNNKDRNRFVRCFAQGIDCMLAFVQSFIQYLSCHILTEIAMSGDSSFVSSAQKVGIVLTAHPMYAAVLHGAEWIFTLVGALSVSLATMCVMVLAIENPKVINLQDTRLRVLEDLDGADANLFAAVGGVLGLFIGYAFMTLMARIAETVLYCYLSLKAQDGTSAGQHPLSPLAGQHPPNVSASLQRYLTSHDLEALDRSLDHVPSSTRSGDGKSKGLPSISDDEPDEGFIEDACNAYTEDVTAE